ncbi:glycine oxidase ThiO [Thermithiobacillus tepidarius DSM 3134]|uniref:glycine oxidase ThiO n=1 Tax=Thermithiobacillus tepidarius TaxID=929 RepID=UPI0003F8070D|nr:glycine oxidase ThiO [Thermithiobacillus tepidarius]
MKHDTAVSPDAVIVGAGVIGMLTALHLHEAGLRVTLLEQGSGPGREASWAGGGIVSPLFPWRYPDSVNQLAAYGQRHYPALAAALAQATGIDPEYQPCGLLMLDTPEQPLNEAAEAWARRWHVVSQSMVDADLTRIQPGIQPTGRALWWPEIGQIRNPRLVKSLAARLQQLKIPVHSDTAVRDIRVRAGRLQALATSRGTLSAGQVLVTAGAWSGQLLAGLGRPLLVEPVRGQMILLRGQPGRVRTMVLAGAHYLVPRRDGRILVGSTLERVGFDKTPTAEAAELLLGKAVALMPELGELAIEHHWAGLRPGSPVGVPYIGPVPEVEGLFVCAGHFRNGIVMAPGSAALIAALLLQRTPPLDPAPYALNRSAVEESIV